MASSTDKRVFEEVDKTEEYGQINIGLTAFLLSVFIITIIYVVRYIRSVRTAAAATPASAIEYQPPANDTLPRSTPSTTFVPINDPITLPGSPRVRVLPTNVTTTADKSLILTEDFLFVGQASRNQ